MDKARIFVSYAREDEREVRRLYWRLIDAGFQPWLDKVDILPGEDWRLAIENAMRSADFVIICLSNTSVKKRGFLQRELRVAFDQWQEKLRDDIYIIPARLEPCELPQELGGVQWMDLFDEDQWPRLVRALHEGMRRLGKAPGAQLRPPIAPSQQTTGQDLIPYALLLSQLADRLRGDDQSVQSPDIQPLHTFRFETVRMDERGRIVERREGRARYFVEQLGDGMTLEMVEIPGGSFMMGSPATEADRLSDESPRHQVNVPSLWMGKFEVTQAQWKAVMGGAPSSFKGDAFPVWNVSWNDAQQFIAALNRKLGLQNKGRQYQYRLPSEAEWEYAARAGADTPFAFGETITPQIVNYNGNYPYASAPKGIHREKTVPIGSLGVANAFGLFDMHGNVWEWCEDVYRDSYNGAPTDGSAWLGGGNSGSRVLRGGSYLDVARDCRSAFRNYYDARIINVIVGFRVVVSARTL